MHNKLILSLAVIGAVVCSVSGLGTYDSAKENRYCGSVEDIEKTETINYDHKERTYSYNMPTGVPAYVPAEGIINNCANIAGASIIGFYDRFCEELIPDYTTYVKLGSAVIYRSDSVSEVVKVMAALYDLMGTNVGGNGTTFDGYQSGMSAYAKRCGYTYSSETVMSGKNFDLDKYHAAITAGKPVSIFLTDYSVYTKTETNGGTDKITYKYNNIGHVVVGYGYYVDTYYDSANKVIATRTYLHVANGQVLNPKCYLCLDGKSTVYTAISSTIS